jgi:nitrate reductase gamma subunit
MDSFIRGPLVWFGFFALFAGSVYNLGSRLALARKDKVVYPYCSGKFGLRSVLHWIVPLGSRSMRLHPLFTLVSFAFHACLLLTPLLVVGHAVLWQQSWGFSWRSLPAGVADAMTLVVILGGVFFILRRIAAPEVRNVTTARDYLIILLVIAPFLTGFIAHHQWLPYRMTLTLHILSGVLWLVAIPFTRLSHMLWFVLTRSYMGSEFGAVRNARDW